MAIQQEEKRKPRYAFKRVVQLNDAAEVQAARLALIKHNSTAALVFEFMVCVSNKRNYAPVSDADLCNLLDLSRSTVTRAITYLAEHGFIAKVKVGAKNSYVINEYIYWRSTGALHKYQHSDLTSRGIHFSPLAIEDKDNMQVAVRKGRDRMPAEQDKQ